MSPALAPPPTCTVQRLFLVAPDSDVTRSRREVTRPSLSSRKPRPWACAERPLGPSSELALVSVDGPRSVAAHICPGGLQATRDNTAYLMLVLCLRTGWAVLDLSRAVAEPLGRPGTLLGSQYILNEWKLPLQSWLTAFKMFRSTRSHRCR